MNISHHEHRALHVLALAGRITHAREGGRTVPSDFSLLLVTRLRRKRLIKARSGRPARLSRRGGISGGAYPDTQGT